MKAIRLREKTVLILLIICLFPILCNGFMNDLVSPKSFIRSMLPLGDGRDNLR